MATSVWHKLTQQSNWSDVFNDVQKKFVGTYLTDLVHQKVYYLKQVACSNDYPEESIFTFITKEGIKSFVTLECPNLQAVFPKRGYFTYNDVLYFSQRDPQRQYSWAPCAKNLIIDKVIDPPGNRLKLDTVHAAIFRKHQRLSPVLLAKLIQGVSLTDNLAVNRVGDTCYLWYNTVNFAQIVGTKIKITEKAFEQELTDYLNRNNITEFTYGT